MPEKQKSAMAFHGILHDKLNLQAIPHISGHLATYLEQPFGVRTVYKEGADTSLAVSNRVGEAIKGHGMTYVIVDAILFQELGGLIPTPDHVQRRIDKIDQTDLDTLINTKLLPQEEIQTYFIAKEMDRLRDEHGEFDIHFEGHTAKTLVRIDELRTQHKDLRNRSSQQWNLGNLAECTSLEKRAIPIMDNVSRIREGEIKPDIAALLKKGLKHPNGGFVYVVFGSAHITMVDQLKRQYGRNPYLVFEGVRQPDTTEYDTDKPQSGTQEEQDLLIARHLFLDHISDDLAAQFHVNNKLAVWAYQWEDIWTCLKNFTDSFDYAEIDRVCRERINLVEFAQNHPLLESIRPTLIQATA